jgi:carboxylesterase type B
VVVTLNYRLGFLGFVSSRKHNITGNMGLKDQVVALQWVQKYGHLFGGDVKQVTLMGWSAGAASVTYHLYSKASEGLFHRAIAMSGSMLNPWAFLYASEEIMSTFFCGLKMSKLTGDSIDDLIPEVNMNLMFSYFGFSNLAFVPSQELRSQNTFLAKPPVELFESPPVNQVPLMIGYTNLEVEFFKNDYEFRVHNPNFPNTDDAALAGIEEYLRNLTESKFSKQKDRRVFHSRLVSKFDIAYGIRELAQKYSKVADVYAYQFAFNGDWNKKRRAKMSGAEHGDELAYLLFDSRKHPEAGHEAERRVRRQMVEMWTNFIKNG